MAFTKSNVNWQFQAPNLDPNLIQQVPDISGGLDSLFNRYMQMKQQGRLTQQDALATEARAGAEKDRQGANMMQYGFDPRQVTPEVLARSQPGMAPQGPAQPGMQSPAEAENPLFGQVRSFLTKRDSAASAAKAWAQTGIDLKRSQIGENNAQAWAARNPVARAAGTNRPPPGYRFLPDGDLEAIKGGPAFQKEQAADRMATTAQNSAIEQADSQIVKVDQALKNVSGWSTGWGGATIGKLPGSQAKDLQGDLDTIKANLGFSMLAEMKRASPTGGALGAISESEMRLLTSARESLDREQSRDQLVRNLTAVKTHYTNWRNAVEQSRQGGGAPVAPAVGITLTGAKGARLAELRAKAGR